MPAPSALTSPFPDHVLITRREYELLQLKDRAMDVVQEGITIADASLPDMPLIYANEGFARVRARRPALLARRYPGCWGCNACSWQAARPGDGSPRARALAA